MLFDGHRPDGRRVVFRVEDVLAVSCSIDGTEAFVTLKSFGSVPVEPWIAGKDSIESLIAAMGNGYGAHNDGALHNDRLPAIATMDVDRIVPL